MMGDQRGGLQGQESSRHAPPVLTAERWGILIAAVSRGALTTRQAAEVGGCSRQAAHDLLRKMVADGLLLKQRRTPRTTRYVPSGFGRRLLALNDARTPSGSEPGPQRD